MPRKPMEVVQINLRIREKLRRLLEQAAKKRGVSLNFEMTSRLQETFDRDAVMSIDTSAAFLKTMAERLDARDHTVNKLGDLVRSAEGLLHAVQGLDSEPVRAAAEKVAADIKMIEAEAVMAVRRAHTT